MRTSARLGIAGLGTVGSGLLQLLQANGAGLTARIGGSLQVTAVSARNRNKDRGVDLSDARWFEDARELARCDDIDIFIELIGGETGVAKDAVEAALQSGKHVITANKALLAHHGAELAALAEAHGVALNFEAAVAGGIPIVKTMRESLLGNRVSRVVGILNGTCNYILTRMGREGRPFAEVLADAQAHGFAEADPTFDVGGFDAAHKLALLTSLAFGTRTSFESVYVEGIQSITPADLEAASDLGYKIKLLGVAVRTETGIEQRVHPTMVPRDSAIAGVDGVLNCVAVDGDWVGQMMLVGPGAGAGPTASAVVSDIVDIVRGTVVPPFIAPASELLPYERGRMQTHQGGYYIRLSVYDRPGAFAAIAGRMSDQGISLESIVQRRPRTALPGIGARNNKPGEPTPVILITHPTSERDMREALSGIEADGHIVEPAQMIRIERF